MAGFFSSPFAERGCLVPTFSPCVTLIPSVLEYFGCV